MQPNNADQILQGRFGQIVPAKEPMARREPKKRRVWRGVRPKQQRKPEIYAYIDSQNLNVSIQKLGWKMDWNKFRKFLEEKYGVTKAFMFIGYVPEFEDMYLKLHESGYSVVLKPTYDMTRPRPEQPEEKPKNSTNGSVPGKEEEDKKPTKGNIDADLVLWAMKDLKEYDKAIIVSGDGDFYVLVEYLVEQGKLAKILAPNRFYSSLFNRYEPYLERLDLHRKELAYRDYTRRRVVPAYKTEGS